MTNSTVATLSLLRTGAEIRKCVVFARLELHNHGGPCGPDAVRLRLAELEVQPLPSRSTIARILTEQCLTYGRIGHYPGEPVYANRKGV